MEYEGDNREFTPHTVNTMRSRIEQEAVVDFVKNEFHSFSNTGISKEKITKSDGTVTFRTARASTENITCDNVKWREGAVEFDMRASVGNPLIPNADTIDYLAHVTVHKNGTVNFRVSHDGFPCLEFYKQADYGAFQTIHIHDPRVKGETVQALAGPMEYSFDKTV